MSVIIATDKAIGIQSGLVTHHQDHSDTGLVLVNFRTKKIIKTIVEILVILFILYLFIPKYMIII